MARSSLYDEGVAEKIIDRMSDGESLRSICRDDDMPDRKTVRRWEDSNPDFAARCARAREHQGDSYVDQMDEISQKLENGDITSDVARVLIANLQWKASKLNRERYGEKITKELTGKDGGPILTGNVTVTPDDAKAISQALDDEC